LPRPISPPPRPYFRERRPVHWWTVLIGITASVIWYVLIGAAAWDGTSLLLGTLAGMVLAGGAAWALVWKGDPGLGIGLAMMIGFAGSFMFIVVGVNVLLDSVEFG
jgi:hypothetical protein